MKKKSLEPDSFRTQDLCQGAVAYFTLSSTGVGNYSTTSSQKVYNSLQKLKKVIFLCFILLGNVLCLLQSCTERQRSMT